MKIKIDQEDCIECRACESDCSKVFVVERGEKVSIIEKYQTRWPSKGEVSNDLSDRVQEAADDFPVEVIDVI